MQPSVHVLLLQAYKKILTEELKEKDTRLRGLEELSGEKLFFIASAMVSTLQIKNFTYWNAFTLYLNCVA